MERINTTIREDQYRYIKENHINFASWVRDMIDKNLMNDDSKGDKK